MSQPPQDPAEEIRRLLGARRHVTPRDGFVENFIDEFHRRQRAEMLRTPAWRLALERFAAALTEFRVPRVAYAGAFGVFLVAVAVTLRMPDPGSGTAQAPALAVAEPAVAPQPAAMRLAPEEVWVALPAPALSSLQTGRMPQVSRSVPPRYVLDARPVSHEPPFSF